MTDTRLKELFDQYTNRKKRIESDCAVVEQVWLVYRDSPDKSVRCDACTWLLKRLEDNDTNKLARAIIYRHLYRGRHRLPKKIRKRFREVLKGIPRSKRKKLKFSR
jgi:hypothetical protein